MSTTFVENLPEKLLRDSPWNHGVSLIFFASFTTLTLWLAPPKMVCNLVQDLMGPKPIVELHGFSHPTYERYLSGATIVYRPSRLSKS